MAAQFTADGCNTDADGVGRCWWCGQDPLYRAYHDREWGRPVTDDVRLFEKICLEGFQSGLSWITILRKRESFRAAFAGFDPEKVSRFDDSDIARLLADPGIVRHRGKIVSTIGNAGRALRLRDEAGSLAAFFWRYVPDQDDRPQSFDRAALVAQPTSATSHRLSRELKRRGWTFVGPTTVYAFMQAMGLVNDHVAGCHARQEIESAKVGFAPPR